MSGQTLDKLVYMANQMRSFFATQPGGVAALQIADHINAFWDPRMRAMIVEHLDQGGEGLTPEALEAVRLIKQRAADKIERALAAAGEPSVGHAPGDDAG